MRTLIIGGGASGLYLGSLLSGSVILEGNASCGRKLLLTGGGRCNYTHSGTVEELLGHYNGNKQFIKKVLYNHKPEDITAYFEALGVRTKEEENGSRYPLSDSAEDIVEALRRRCDIIQGRVSAIEPQDGFFLVRTEKQSLKAESLVLAPGGMAYPRTGSDGNGYALLERLGHTIVKPHPALSQLSLSEPLGKAEGVSLEARLRCGRKERTGDIIITKNGLSGPAALNISRELPGEICISFLDKVDLSQAQKLVRNALPLPSRLTEALLGELAEKRCGNLSKQERVFITSRLTRFTSYASPVSKSAMATAGGVDTSEIDPFRMESRIVKGLYLAGEIVDVDGECGGYNLTWAFSSAYAVFKALSSPFS